MQKSLKLGALCWKIEKIVSKGDYNYCIIRNHPNRTKNDYVLHHRVVVENHLGRLLNPNEVVHHINGDKKDNRIENLQVVDALKHTRSHNILKGEQMIELKCPQCNSIFHRRKGQTHLSKPSKWTACSRSCAGKFSKSIQLYGITPQVEKAISENVLSEYKRYLEDNTEVTHLQEEP